MSANKEMNDAFRDRNLQRIGRVLSLPPRADAARQARWQQESPATDAEPVNKKESIMRRYRRFAFVTTGVLAASITLIVWLGLGGTKSVSAETIFANLRAKLGRSLSITIKGIEWDNVAIDGTILIDRAVDVGGDDSDTVYAELNTLFKADNPKWNDLDGASVLCLSPAQSWWYMRGSGGSCARPFEVRPAEMLYRGAKWRSHIKRQLSRFELLNFGSCSFSAAGAGEVNYGFHTPQRDFVQQLLRYLFDLSNAQRVDGLLSELQAAARESIVEKVDKTTWILHASDFRRIGSLQPPDPQLPAAPDDLGELFKDTIWELSYDNRAGRLLGTGTSNTPALLRFGRGVDHEKLADEIQPYLSSSDDLLEFLEDRARTVEVDTSPSFGWKIRVVGYPMPLAISSDWQWAVKNIPQLLRDVELTVYYNTETDEVDRAEFHNIASPGSLITLEPGRVDIAPGLLDPDRWMADDTRILRDSAPMKSGVTIVPNPFKMLLDLFTKPRDNPRDDETGE